MKKILLGFLAINFLIPSMAMAQDGAGKATVNQIFQIQDLPNTDKNLLKDVPKAKDEVYYTDLYSSLAKIFLGVGTLLVFVGIVVAGVILVGGAGEEGATTKAKSILTYIVVGVILMAAAYAVVTGITRFKPF